MIESEETSKLFLDSCDLITESINELIFIINQRNEIEYSNNFPVIKSLGYKNDELIGNSWLNYVCPEDLETAINLLEDSSESESIAHLLKLQHKNGNLKTFEFYSKTAEGYNGQKKTLIVLKDITEMLEQKKAKNEIKELSEKYSLIIENANDLIAVYNEKLELEFVNEIVLKKLVGYSFDELKRKKSIRIIHPDDIEIALDNFKNVFEYGEAMGETRVRCKDGRYKWLESKGKSFIEKGKRKVILISRDITERKEAEQKLKVSEKNFRNLSEEFELILDHFPGLIFSKDAKNNFIHVNQNVVASYNRDLQAKRKIVSKKELEGNSLFDILPRDIAQAYWDDDLEVIKSGLPKLNIEESWESEEGTNWISTSKIPFTDENGSIKGIIGISTDITESKKAEQKLKESEEEYRTLIDSISDIIFEIDFDGKITYLSPQSLDMLGYRPEELINQNTFRFIHPDDQEEVLNNQKYVINSGEIGSVEFRVRHKEGHYITVSSRAQLIEKDDKKKIVGLFRDITEHKGIEERVNQEREKAELYLDLVNVIIVALDKDGNISLINKKGNDILGYTDGELIHKNWFQNCLPLHDRERVQNYFNKLMKGETDITPFYENSVITKYGDEKLIAWSTILFRDSNGNITGLLSSGEDITERKNAEQKLKESEEKFRTIAEQSFTGILITVDNKIEYVNNALLQIFEYSNGDIANWTTDNIVQMIHPDDLQFLREYREKLRRGDPNVKPYYSYRVFTKSGKLKWVDQFSTVINYMGRPAELVTVMDITEKKVAEQELVKLNSLKSEFMRRTSHELKTPLVSIKGYSDLLLSVHKEKLDDYVLASVVEIKQGCERLESLIQDILNTAELESGKVQLKKIVDDLSFFIKLSVRELRGLARLRNHNINLTIPDKLITSFEPEQMRQVISNLINNAIKYTPPDGIIEIESEIKDNLIIVSIKDSGIGITKEEKERLFTQFGKIERYGQGLDIISDGSGLGLYISKKIVELHGGKIWVESEGRNEGSTFYFTLPIIQETIE